MYLFTVAVFTLDKHPALLNVRHFIRVEMTHYRRAKFEHKGIPSVLVILAEKCVKGVELNHLLRRVSQVSYCILCMLYVGYQFVGVTLQFLG